jgi:hypothetical protein
MKYLVDSLQSYETGHGDALCPIQTEADQSFMGDHLQLKAISIQEFREMKMSLDRRLINVVETVETSIRSLCKSDDNSTLTLYSMHPSSPCPGPIRTPPETPRIEHPYTSASMSMSAPRTITAASKSTLTISTVTATIPDLRRGPNAWLQAVEQWEIGDPETNMAPLKDWPAENYTGAMRLITGTKRSMRKLIACEFIRCSIFFRLVLRNLTLNFMRRQARTG